MRSHFGVLIAIVAVMVLAPASRGFAAPPPAFELVALGVLGGGDESNLSSFLLARPGEVPSLMIDGGSPMSGILRWKERFHALAPNARPAVRYAALVSALAPVRAVLLSHSHLDHWAGLLLFAPFFADLAAAGRAPLELVALAPTVETLRAHLFNSGLWADFTQLPSPDHPAIRLVAAEANSERDAGPFRVRLVPLIHTQPSAAFLIMNGPDAYLHLGDSGPSTEVWDAARPYLASGHLRAISLEASFPSTKDAKAIATGHLTPHLIIVELAKLAHCEAIPRTLAARLKGVRIIAIHIKLPEYEAVAAELTALKRAGLDIIIPEQGATYRF